ncbi:MAG: hypothetical protein U0575_11315 [Phycisphaerales bacterium]
MRPSSALVGVVVSAISMPHCIGARAGIATIATSGAAAALATAATAQSDNDLRTENQALRTRVHDLELELAAARARIAEVEKRLADAEARARAAGAGQPATIPGAVPGAAPAGPGPVPPPQPPETTFDDTSPTASPVALLKALQADYAQALAGVGGHASPKERTVYFRALEKWISQANRHHRTPIDWLVLTESVGAVGDKQVAMRVVAIDPGNGNALGDAFETTIPVTIFRRLEAAGLTAKGQYLRLRGTLVPSVRLNDRRDAVGPFDQPRFIGPFAELGFTVEATSATAASPPATAPPHP